MTIEPALDGTVRVPGAPVLAGSALCLDAAVRNLMQWGILTPAEALGLASTVPAALLAPALDAHDITLPPSQMEWWPRLCPARIRIGDVEQRFPEPTGGGSGSVISLEGIQFDA